MILSSLKLVSLLMSKIVNDKVPTLFRKEAKFHSPALEGKRMLLRPVNDRTPLYTIGEQLPLDPTKMQTFRLAAMAPGIRDCEHFTTLILHGPRLTLSVTKANSLIVSWAPWFCGRIGPVCRKVASSVSAWE